MIPALNGYAERPADSLAILASRLTGQDRETYAALISYRDSLPPGDEFLRVIELLGLLSLVGQRVPDALAEFLAELRAQTKASTEYHAQVDRRLARLPQEIAAGVDVSAIAEGMSESFRQQLARTGLQDTAALLKTATGTIKTLSAEIAASLKPAAQEYRGIASTLTSEGAKLVSAARLLEQHNERLIAQQRVAGWLWQGLLAVALFLVGGVCGILLEKSQTTDVLSDIDAQIQRLQPLPARIMPVTKKSNGGKR